MSEYKKADLCTIVNPYNFVSSSDRVEIEEEGKLYTGYLDCHMYVKTPLCIPDVEKVKFVKGKKTDKHPVYPFYTIDGMNPVVPGSSIRGMIRSAYEAATGSCMSTLKNHTRLTRRVGSREKFNAALLIRENNNWNLYQAERYLLPVEGYKTYYDCKAEYFLSEGSDGRYLVRSDDSKVELHSGDRVTYVVKTSKEKEWCKKKGHSMWAGVAINITPDEKGNGYVFIGEKFGNKKHGESIFVKKAMIPCQNIEALMEGLEETLRLYRDKAINRKYDDEHSGYANYERAKARGVIPVWSDYTRNDNTKAEKKAIHLSLASIGRILYDTTLNDLVGKQQHCEKRNQLCPACRLFGMIGEESTGSRVRFCDAGLVTNFNEKEDLKEITLKELGSPRSSYLPFYASNGYKREASYDDTDAGIKGRKFYWHQPKAKEDASVYSSDEKTERNATMELLMPKAEFSFRVYYDGITEKELKNLMWILTLGENEKESDLCYKLGHGKPIGLGSVKITIEQKADRSMENGYDLNITEQIRVPKDPEFLKTESVDELLKMCSWSAMADEQVCYPYVELNEKTRAIVEREKEKGRELKENVLASHRWFSNNKEEKAPLMLKSPLEEHRFPIYKVIALNREKDFQRKKETAEKTEEGRVKFYDYDSGYGYIARLDEKADVKINEFSMKNREDLLKLGKGTNIQFKTRKDRNGKLIAVEGELI